MELIKICAICGEEFIAHGNRATYCKKCAKDRGKLYWQKRKQKIKVAFTTEEAAPEIFFCDTPENIETCINCTRDICLLDKNRRCPDMKKGKGAN